MDLGGLGAAPGGWLNAIDTGENINLKRQRGQLQQQAIQDAQLTQVAQGGIGRTLQLLSSSGGRQGPPPPAPQPGQASQPQPQPVPAAPTSPGQTPTVGSAMQPGPAVPGGQPVQQAQVQPTTQQGAGPTSTGRMITMPPSGPQQQPQQQPARQERKSQLEGGPLTLRELLAAATRANPGAPPAVIARVVDGLIPLLKIEEQNAWREQQVQLKQLQLAETVRRHDQLELDATRKFMQEDAKLEEKIRATKNKEEIAGLEQQRKEAKDQFNRENATRKEQRLLETGLRRDETKRAEITSRENIAALRATTTLTKEQMAERAKMEQIGVTGAQKLEQIGARGAEARETEDVKAAHRLEQIDRTGEIRKSLQGESLKVKQEIAYMLETGRMDRADASDETKRFLGSLTMEQRDRLAAASREAAAARQDKTIAAQTERQEKGQAFTATQKDKDRELRKQIADERAKLLERSIAWREARFQEQRARLSPTLQEDLKRAEAEGFDADTVAREANHYVDTGKYTDRVNKLTGVAKRAALTAIGKYVDEEIRPTALALETNARRYKSSQKAIDQFLNPSSVTGQAVRGLSVIQDHLNTYKEALAAWDPKDMRAFNRIAAKVSKEFGGTAATNLDALGHVIGTEMMRALGVRGAGTLAERQGYEEALASAPDAETHQSLIYAGMLAGAFSGPLGIALGAIAGKLADMGFNTFLGKGGVTLEQGYGIVEQYQKLLNGQLKGYRKQWETDTMLPGEMFDAMLTDAAQKEMQRQKEGGPPNRPPRPAYHSPIYDKYRGKGYGPQE